MMINFKLTLSKPIEYSDESTIEDITLDLKSCY